MELAVSTDMLLEGRHFRAGADARKLGHKALAVNLSDMAAMGAAPRWATLALALPAADEAWLDGFAQGILRARGALRRRTHRRRHHARAARPSFCVTILGEVPSGLALFRAGAWPGDDIWVSGELGGAALGLAQPANAAAAAAPGRARAARRTGRAAARDRQCGDRRLGRLRAGPRPHSGALGRRRRGRVRAPARVSGGPDDASQVLLSGGDDYELVFTARAGAPRRDRSACARAEAGAGARRIDPEGRADAAGAGCRRAGRWPLGRGFDHFAP